MLTRFRPSPFADATRPRYTTDIGWLLDAAATMLGQSSSLIGAENTTTERAPAMSIWREESAVIAEFEVPGYTIDDIEVLTEDDTLTIRGERCCEQPANGNATPIRVERTHAKFERSINLGAPINEDGTEATLTNGVLRVSVPLASSAKPRRITIRSSSNDAIASVASEKHTPECCN